MSFKEYISLDQLCLFYEIEPLFFTELKDAGLVKLEVINALQCIHTDDLPNVEKMIRIHKDLEINIAGIDTVFQLLKKMEELRDEVNTLKSRLSLYEDY